MTFRRERGTPDLRRTYVSRLASLAAPGERTGSGNEKGPGVAYAGAERVVARPYSAMGYPSLTQASVPPSML